MYHLACTSVNIIAIPSYQYSSLAESKLDPNFITGFIDAEGCFYIMVIKNLKRKLGFRVSACFSISLHKKDRVLLESIRSYFGVGTIFKTIKDYIQYRVEVLGDLKVIIDHFNKYPLITQKRADYELFKCVVEIMNRKEHLKKEGLEKLVSIKSSLNKGLSPKLKIAFPHVNPIQRPLVVDQKIFSPY